MKRQWIVGMGVALCAAPVAVGLSGCNGDSNSGGPFAPTPTPTATRSGTATPTPTRSSVTPTATPPVTTTAQRLVGQISAATSDYNGLTGALNLPQFSSAVDAGSIAAVFSALSAQPEFRLQLNLNPANGSESTGVTPGTYVVVGGGEARNAQVSIRQRGFTDSFFATSGNVVVESVQSGIVRFRLVNVRFETFEDRNAPPPAPRGDFTLNASGQLRTSCPFPAQCQ